jgi:hypothetical protein
MCGLGAFGALPSPHTHTHTTPHTCVVARGPDRVGSHIDGVPHHTRPQITDAVAAFKAEEEKMKQLKARFEGVAKQMDQLKKRVRAREREREATDEVGPIGHMEDQPHPLYTPTPHPDTARRTTG